MDRMQILGYLIWDRYYRNGQRRWARNTMDIEQFIETTLTQIISGVKKPKTLLRTLVGIVNLTKIERWTDHSAGFHALFFQVSVDGLHVEMKASLT